MNLRRTFWADFGLYCVVFRPIFIKIKLFLAKKIEPNDPIFLFDKLSKTIANSYFF